MNSIRSKKTLESRIRSLIAGTTKHFPNAAQVTFGGQTYTSAALVQIFDDLLAALVAVDAAMVVFRDAVKTAGAKKALVGPVVLAYQRYLLAFFGNTSVALADFDLVPHKARVPLTVEQKTAAAAKVKATRTARHTMGSRKKLAIKGTVTPPAGGDAVAANAVSAAPPKAGA